MNYCNSLLLQVLRIEPSTLNTDRHSSVTRPSRADSSLTIPTLSTRSTKATIPDLSIRATFIDAPEWTQICSLAKLRLLFLWMVAVRDRVLVNTRSCKIVSVSILPSCKAIRKSVTSSGIASKPDCSDLSVGLDGSNRLASNSTMHTSKSWIACSSFLILAGWHSTCFLWRFWHFWFLCRAAFTLATLFAFLVLGNNCFSFCNSWSHPCSSLELRFIVVSIRRRSGWYV